MWKSIFWLAREKYATQTFIDTFCWLDNIFSRHQITHRRANIRLVDLGSYGNVCFSPVFLLLCCSFDHKFSSRIQISWTSNWFDSQSINLIISVERIKQSMNLESGSFRWGFLFWPQHQFQIVFWINDCLPDGSEKRNKYRLESKYICNIYKYPDAMEMLSAFS